MIFAQIGFLLMLSLGVKPEGLHATGPILFAAAFMIVRKAQHGRDFLLIVAMITGGVFFSADDMLGFIRAGDWLRYFAPLVGFTISAFVAIRSR